MATLKRFLHRTLVFLPSLLLAASWPALWLTWPMGTPRGSASSRGMPDPRGRFVGSDISKLGVYLRPDLFGRSGDVGFRSAEVEAHSDATLLTTVERPPRTLPWDSGEGHHALPVRAASLSDLAGRELGELVVPLAPSPVSEQPIALGFRLVVSADRVLTDAGFRMGKGLREVLGEGDKAWSARLWVSFDREREVVHALIEKGTGSDALDRILVGAMNAARMEKAQGGTSGWVTIEYGRL